MGGMGPGDMKSNTTSTFTNTYAPFTPAVCPHCGRCMHCGRGGPYYPPYPVGPWYWNGITYTQNTGGCSHA